MSGVVVLRCASRVGEGTCSRNQEIWFLCLTLQIQYSFMVWIWCTGNVFHTPCSPILNQRWVKKFYLPGRGRTDVEKGIGLVRKWPANISWEGRVVSPFPSIIPVMLSGSTWKNGLSYLGESCTLLLSRKPSLPSPGIIPIRSGQRLVLNCHWDQGECVCIPQLKSWKAQEGHLYRHILVTLLTLK